MKTETATTTAIGTGRVMEIILFLVGEMRRNKQLGDIDLGKLSARGFSELEVSTAFSWLFDKVAISSLQSRVSDPATLSISGQSAFRVYHELEQSFLSSEARGFLIQLRELDLLKDSDMELLIDRLWFIGATDITLDAVREAAAELIFDFSDASRMDQRVLLNVSDRIQ
ncbi:MAG: DUF494 family protein [bacterium]